MDYEYHWSQGFFTLNTLDSDSISFGYDFKHWALAIGLDFSTPFRGAEVRVGPFYISASYWCDDAK